MTQIATNRQMPVITICNEKGGVSKTTLTTEIAAELARRGLRVLVVDADPQGHAGELLGVGKFGGMYNWLVKGLPLARKKPADMTQAEAIEEAKMDVLRQVPRDRWALPGDADGGFLAVIGSNVETRNIANSISDAFALKRELDKLRKLSIFDFVLVDTSPTASLLHGLIYIATTFFTTPTQYETLSVDGIYETLNRIEELRAASPNFGAYLGYVPTQVKKGRVLTGLFEEALDELPRFTTIHDWEVIRQAQAAGKLVHIAAPDSEAAAEFEALVDQFLEAVEYA